MIRYEGNPVLTKEDVPFNVNSIFNPGAVKLKDEYILLSRVEMPTGRSSFVIARSKDGYNFTVDQKLCLTPEGHGEFSKYAEWGIEDPRITKIEDDFYIVYTGYSKYEPLVMLAKTNDFKIFEIIGPISEPSNKDAALFPEKINGYYWKVDRPSGESRRDIWINSSPDLIHWGNYKCLMEPEKGTWEDNKIGCSTQPIKTKEGWLMLYHGVRGFGISYLYKLGVVLLDLDNPTIVKAKCSVPILSPDKDYERIGDVGNVVFANGWIAEDNGDVLIYYSGADTNICVAKTTVEYLVSICK